MQKQVISVFLKPGFLTSVQRTKLLNEFLMVTTTLYQGNLNDTIIKVVPLEVGLSASVVVECEGILNPDTEGTQLQWKNAIINAFLRVKETDPSFESVMRRRPVAISTRLVPDAVIDVVTF